MRKLLLSRMMLLLCALMAGSGSAWADATVTITRSSFGEGTGGYDTYDWTADGVSGKGQIYANTTNSIQMNGGNASGKIIYNTTAVPGSIKKINIVRGSSGSNRSYSVYGRTTAYSGTGDYGTLIATANIQTSGRDYTVTSGDYNYFVIVNASSNAAYIASITVTYDNVTKHTLSSAVSPSDVGSVTLGATSVGEGKSTTIEAVVTNAAYRFKNWTTTSGTVAAENAASTTFTMGTADATVTANFELIPTHKANVTTPSGGTITIKNGDDVIAAGSDVLEGTELTIIATAGANKKFNSWSVTGATPVSTTDATTTFTMGTTDVTIAATFDDATTYAIHWSINGSVVKTDNVVEDEAIDFSAPASGVPAGYVLMGWSESSIDTPQADETGITYVSSATSTAEKTYYAVLAVQTASLPDTYEKLASNSFEANATYVLAGKQSSDNTTIWYLKSYENVDEDSSWGVCTSTPASEEPVTFTLSGTASALVAQDNSGNYLTCITAKKYAMSSTSTTVYLDTDGSIKSASDGNYMRYNYNTGNGGLRWYSGTTTGQQAYFYKVIKNSTYANFCTTVPTATITLASACTDGTKYYGTYSNGSAFVVPADLTVSTIGVSGGKLTVSDYETGDVVKANTGVMVSSTTSGNHTVTLTTATGTELEGNMLKASGDAGIEADDMDEDDTKFYRLTMHDGTTIGFWWGAANGAAFDLAANKAYLAVPDAAAARIQSFWLDGETAGISSMHNSQCIMHNEVYDLQGRRVESSIFNSQSSILKKGLYIVNGKKVIK